MEEKKDKNDKDLCLTCKHYWEDFPMLMEDGVSHCKKKLMRNTDLEA